MQKKHKNKIILAFSGGLDTSFCVAYLKKQDFEVITLTVDTGGFSKQDIQKIASQTKLLGVKEHYFINAKSELFNNFVSYIIKGNILRGGVYPLCAGTERLIIAQKMIQLAKLLKVKYIAHGSTGAGNDQIRFDVAIKVLGSEFIVLSPIRDLSISRAEEIDFLKKANVYMPEETKSYSINQGMLGTTIGGKETKGSWDYPPEEIYPGINPISKTPDEATTLEISFSKGLPVAINKKKMSGVQIMEELRVIGSKHGVGKNMHLGNAIIGIKGRIAFAAPAVLILIQSHKELEKLVTTKWQSFWKDILADFYGSLLHEALYFDPVMRDIEALINSSQKFVTGEVRVRLFKGNIIIEGSKSPYSLLKPEIATYGEENSLWNGADVAGFSKIYSIQSMLAHSVLRKKKDEKD